MADTLKKPDRKYSIESVIPELWDELSRDDLNQVCLRTGAVLEDDSRLKIKFLGDWWIVDLANQEVKRESGQGIPYWDKSCPFMILNYLLQCGDGELSGQMISPRDMIPGNNFFQGEHSLKTEPLISLYGNDPDAFKKAILANGGTIGENGDASGIFKVFEKIVVEIILWRADEEFAADLNVLIDSNSRQFYSVDTMYGALSLLLKRLEKQGGDNGIYHS